MEKQALKQSQSAAELLRGKLIKGALRKSSQSARSITGTKSNMVMLRHVAQV